MAWIRIIEKAEAQGDLLEAYTALSSRPLPQAYIPPHGGPAGIQRAHSLDPALMRIVFMTSGSTFQGDALSWADRELLATVASRTNQCVY
jgi:alkylhydroperoxidase family enzyme